MKCGERSITIKSKTDLQPPGLLRPPSSHPLGSQWALEVLFMAEREAVHKTSFWSMSLNRSRQGFSEHKTQGFLTFLYDVRLWKKCPLNPPLYELFWELLPVPSRHWILSRQADDKWWWSRSSQCLPYIGTALSTYLDSLTSHNNPLS